MLNDRGENLAEILKYTYIDRAKWNTSDMMNVVIGQGQKCIYTYTNGKLCIYLWK